MKFRYNIRLMIAAVALVLGLASSALCQEATLKPLADAYVGVWNTGNVEGLDAIMAADFVRHADPTAQSSAMGLDSMKTVIKNARATFSDFNVTVHEEIYSDNKAVLRWTYSGTHSGMGNEALAGNTVKTSGISVVHFADGKMVEEWAAWDNLHSMMQLGMTLTPPESEDDEE